MDVHTHMWAHVNNMRENSTRWVAINCTMTSVDVMMRSEMRIRMKPFDPGTGFYCDRKTQKLGKQQCNNVYKGTKGPKGNKTSCKQTLTSTFRLFRFDYTTPTWRRWAWRKIVTSHRLKHSVSVMWHVSLITPPTKKTANKQTNKQKPNASSSQKAISQNRILANHLSKTGTPSTPHIDGVLHFIWRLFLHKLPPGRQAWSCHLPTFLTTWGWSWRDLKILSITVFWF